MGTCSSGDTQNTFNHLKQEISELRSSIRMLIAAPPPPPNSQSSPATIPNQNNKQDSAVPEPQVVADVPGTTTGHVQPENATVDAPADPSKTMNLDISVSSMEEFLPSVEDFLPSVDHFDFSESLNSNVLTTQQSLLRP